MNTSVKCPGCNKTVEWNAAAKWKPFCSERCKLIDLGAWADGSHSIPGEDVPSQADNLDEGSDS